MKPRVLNIVFCGIFMLALVIPLVFVDPLGGGASVRENRMLASRPALSGVLESPAEYIKQFDAWFSDNIGLREGLLDIHEVINRLEESDHYTDGKYTFVIGKQGHRFFGEENGLLIRKFQGKHKLVSDELLPELSAALGDIKAYLDKKDIPLIVMFGAGKETIYPEFYPDSITPAPGPDQLDELTDYIKTHAGVDIFNIRARLLDAKRGYPVFVKAEGDLYHYNELGAFFAYDALMEHIRTYFPDMTPISIEDLNISLNADDNADLSLKFQKDWRALDDSFFDGVELNRPYTDENVAFEHDDPKLPVILCMRDSDMGSDYARIGRFLPHHFSKTIFIHYGNMANFKTYVELYKPDIVVISSAERALPSFANVIRLNRVTP